MNKYCAERIELAYKLINENLTIYKDQVIAVYVSSSVGRGDADENSDIDIKLVYKDLGHSFKMYATLEDEIAVDWVWEPLERYIDTKEILCHFTRPHDITNSICIFDPEGWFCKLKNEISSFVNNREYIQKRVEDLWKDKLSYFDEAFKAVEYKEFEYYFGGFLSSMLIPVTACSVDPSARKLLLQAKNCLHKLNAEKQAEIFHQLLGCHDIKKEEAYYFLDKMMEVFDYYLRVQKADYCGINKPKRNCHYYGIKKFIDDGFYRESMYPIIDWMTVANEWIAIDTGEEGWWTDYKDKLYKRLRIHPDYWDEKKDIMNEVYNVIVKYCLE